LELAKRIKKNIEKTRGLNGVDIMLAAHPDIERGLWSYGDDRKSTDPVVRKLEEINAGGHGIKILGNAPTIRDKIERHLGDISHRAMKEEVYQYLLETPERMLIQHWDQEIKVPF
jgi:hypothetical protein